VTQKDDAWTDQTGAPRDPQPGNGPGKFDNTGGPEDDTDKVPTIHGSTPGGRPPLLVEDPISEAQGTTFAVSERDIATGATDLGVVEFTAAGGIDGITFAADTSTITVDGLDDLASLDWTLADDGKTLTASLAGGPDVLRLELSGDDTIAPGETGSVVVVVTLLAAMPHQDDPNADQLVISGITLEAQDAADGPVATTVSVTVFDDRPSISINPAVADDTPWFDGVMPGETVEGTWSLRQGADTAGVQVDVNGELHDLGSAIDVVVDGVSIGTLIVAANGTWQFTASADLPADKQVNLGFSLIATDADGDVARAVHDIGIGGDMIPTPGPDPYPDPYPNPHPGPNPGDGMGSGSSANNGVGNGVDPQPPGNPPVNDDIPDTPGDPGNQGGPTAWDPVIQDFSDTESSSDRTVMVYDDVDGTLQSTTTTDAQDSETALEPATFAGAGLENDWLVKSSSSSAA